MCSEDKAAVEFLQELLDVEGLAGVRAYLRDQERKIATLHRLEDALSAVAEAHKEQQGVAVPEDLADHIASQIAIAVVETLSVPFSLRLVDALRAECARE